MITSISLITSLGCSLKCDYCQLAKDEEHIKHLQLQEKNIQALKDGSFLKNVQKTLKSLDVLPEAINQIVFWGMEPTLTLKYLTQNIKDWFEVFPNWELCFFSTNGQQNYQDIYDFVEQASQYSIHPFQMKIQVSYDGPKFTVEHRHAKENYLLTIQETLNKNIEKKEKHDFIFILYPHAVLAVNTIKYLNTLNLTELINYFTQQQENSFISQQDKYIFINPNISYGLENPYNYTSQDGRNLYTLLKKMLNSNNNILKQEAFKILRTCITKIKNNPDELFTNIKDLENYCGNYTKGLYIKYDGTVVNCTTFPFKNYFNNSLTKYNYFYHPDNKIDKNFYDNYWQTLNEESAIFSYNNIKNNIKILAKYGEIDSNYLSLDEETLDRHVRYVFSYNNCFSTYYNLTNSSLLKPLSHIKLLCNGVCFLVDDYINLLIERDNHS